MLTPREKRTVNTLARYFIFGLLTVSEVLYGSSARASDLLDCLETGVLPLTNLQDIEETAEFLLNNDECVQYLIPPDGVRIGVVVAGGEALKAANSKYNLFSNKSGCESLAGTQVAKDLLNTGFADAFTALGPGVKQSLQSAASSGVNESIQQIPVVGDFLPCVCGFSVTHFSFDDPAGIFNKYATSINACTNVATDIKNTVSDVLNAIGSFFGSFFDSVASFFGLGGGGDPLTYQSFYSATYTPLVPATLHASATDLNQSLAGISQVCHALAEMPFGLTVFSDADCDHMQGQFMAEREVLLRQEQAKISMEAQKQQQILDEQQKKKEAEEQQEKEAEEQRQEKEQEMALLGLKRTASKEAHDFTSLQYGLWNPKCKDAQCISDISSVGAIYALSYYSAFVQNGGKMAQALAQCKPILPVFQEKIDQSDARLKFRIAQDSAAAQATAFSYKQKAAGIRPAVSRFRQTAAKYHLQKRADLIRLVETARKPNQYRGQLYLPLSKKLQ